MASNIEELLIAADEAMRDGRTDAAVRLWSEILRVAPDNATATFRLGQDALMHRDLRRAQTLLRRATELSPKDPTVPLNMSFAFRASGDSEGEITALEQALTIDPYFFPALLAKAAFISRIGKHRLAARAYKDVLTVAPPPETLPTEMRQMVDRAHEIVNGNAAAMRAHLDAEIAGLTDGMSARDLERFRECRDVAIGLRQVYTQRPTLLHFPGLPAIQYYNRALFPQIDALEEAVPVIREELLNLLTDESQEFRPYVSRKPGTPLNQWAELNFSPKWSAFFFWKDGHRLAENCIRCPRTAALLDTIDMAQIQGYAPTAFFSLLAPHTHIPPHTGATNTRLIVHVPLIIPRECRFRVGSDTREWREREGWVFDDTIEHEAWNDSDQTRVILIFDVWNPYLTPTERLLISPLLQAIDRYYRSD